jgi:hypothetical protein
MVAVTPLSLHAIFLSNLSPGKNVLFSVWWHRHVGFLRPEIWRQDLPPDGSNLWTSF